jgi:hypothetical protein
LESSAASGHRSFGGGRHSFRSSGSANLPVLRSVFGMLLGLSRICVLIPVPTFFLYRPRSSSLKSHWKNDQNTPWYSGLDSKI